MRPQTVPPIGQPIEGLSPSLSRRVNTVRALDIAAYLLEWFVGQSAQRSAEEWAQQDFAASSRIVGDLLEREREICLAEIYRLQHNA